MNVFRKPDVIIYGEYPHHLGHARQQARGIRWHKPEFVIVEDMRYGDTGEINDIYQFATLQNLLKLTELKPEDIGIDHRLVDQLYEHQLKTSGSFSGRITYVEERLLETPLFEFSISMQPFLEEAISRKKRENSGDPIIELKYDTILDALPTFMRRTDQERARDVVCYAGTQVGAKFVGYGTDKLKIDLDDSLSNERISEHIAEREKTMACAIAEYARTRKTNKPNVAIVARGHIEKGNLLLPLLKEEDVKYVAKPQRIYNQGQQALKIISIE